MITYTIVDRRSGNVVGDFTDQSSALEFVRSEMTTMDQWDLFEFGPSPTEGRFVAGDDELVAQAAGDAPLVAAAPSTGGSVRIATGLGTRDLWYSFGMAFVVVLAVAGVTRITPQAGTETVGDRVVVFTVEKP
jgi:hypothetical protein